MLRAPVRWVSMALLLVLVGSCSDQRTPQATSPSDPVLSATARDGSIVVDLGGKTRPFDRRLLGTNAPAWIGPAKLADVNFQQRIRDLGTTVVRMPGGSWSSSYDWLACENGDANGCYWTWAAKPTDYVGFLAATGLDGMWTADFNGTAQEAAALVAFFNASVDDKRVIGVDRRGKDWGTVGQWATLRSEHGHRDPRPIKYWEIGNEVYGAKADKAPGCASFGWEDVWTCDGTAYVNGDDQHDGFLKFREAMRAVDPNILVGAVGIGGHQGDWGGFGNKVIEGAGDALDFYIVHDYGFNSRPSIDAVLRRPQDSWPDVMRRVRAALDEQNSTRAVPVAITEYNLFAFADGDTSGMMSESINALYIADTIGQMAEQGATFANQWNLVNGATASGSDYGLLDPDTSEPKPQFYALALWSSFGDELLPVSVGFDTKTTLSAYAGRGKDGKLSLMVVNKTDAAQPVSIQLKGATTSYTAKQDVLTTTALDATGVIYNGTTGTVSNLASLPAQDLGSVTAGAMTHSFDPFSITLLQLVPNVIAG